MSPIVVEAESFEPAPIGAHNWPNTVTIGPFVADDSSDDFRLTVKLTGWTDAPQVLSSIEGKVQQDGGWDGSGFFEPRVITVEGVVDQRSHADAMAVADALTSLAPRTVHTMTVANEAAGSRSARVRVTVGAVIEWINSEAFTYALQVTAPDPLKYGPAVTVHTTLSSVDPGAGRVWPRVWARDWGAVEGGTPGSLALPNAGTAAYYPTLRIDGYVSNPVITLNGTGDFIRYNGSVLTGQWLEVDCANRRVLLNGQVSRRELVTAGGDWLRVPVGGAALSWSADAANGSAKLTAWGKEGAFI